jgi:hypothetical protein
LFLIITLAIPNVSFLLAQSPDCPEIPDIIYFNAKIVTMDPFRPTAEAIAI